MSTSVATPPKTADPDAALPTLRFCTAGSVDDGKSTFVGRLLLDTESIHHDQYESVEKTSRAKGLEAPDLSLVVDGLRAEREQGITIDVAYRYFSTPKRSFILADTPGHVQYTRNTVTGMSTAELVIVLVDARHGLTEQTRRHVTVAALMQIAQVVIAVNKIDAVGYDQEVFDSLAAQARELGAELGLVHLDVVPTSALLGDNIATRSPHTPWYDGPAVLEILESARPEQYATDTRRDLRFPIQVVIRDHASDYRGYAGRIAAGRVAVGETVSVTGGRTAIVTAIHGPAGAQQQARRGESVTLRLDRDIDLSRGDLIAGEEPVPARNQVTATLVQLSENPVRQRAAVLLRYGTSLVRAKVLNLAVPASNGEGETRTSLELNEIATATIAVAEPVAFEAYRRGGRVGSLLLIDSATGDTLAAGLVQAESE